MKKYAPWVAVVVALVVVLVLLLAPKLSAKDEAVTVTATPEVTASATEAPTDVPVSDVTEVPTEEPTAAPVADATEEPAAAPVSEGAADPVQDMAEDTMATVNGQAVSYSDVDEIAQSLMYTYSQYGYDFSDENMSNMVYSMALEYAIQLEVMEQKAAEWGFDQMSAEETAAAEAEVAAEWENLIDTYILYYVGLAEDATEEDKAAARVTAIAGLEAMGYTQEVLMKDYTESIMFEKVEAEMVKGVTVTDEDVKAAFDEAVAADEASYANDIGNYEYMTQYYGQTSYYQPEGYRGITHILLEVDEALLSEYQTLAAELEELQEAEEEATVTDLASPSDLVTQEKVDAAYAAVIASVQPTIDEINQKLADGVSFEDLIVEYGKDPGMEVEPNKSEGYSVHMDSIVWDPAFVKAAFSVDNVGDIAEPVLGNYGVHIVKYHRDVPAGAVELTEELAASLREELLATKENEVFDSTMTEWMNAAEVVYTAVEPDVATATDAE